MAFSLGHGYRSFLNISFLFLLCFFVIIVVTRPSTHPLLQTIHPRPIEDDDGCLGLRDLNDYHSRCTYLLQRQRLCAPLAYIDYLNLFYCVLGEYPTFLGYALLSLWLLLLFYLLGNTASLYFCSSLDGLSKALNLSPSVAGVTLLSLGNGAPDVFASIVSFAGSGNGEVVGLSCVIGGAFFVSTIVVGVVSLVAVCNSPPGVDVLLDRPSFLRDSCFFLAVLSALLAILVSGRISFWGSICFFFLYFIYAFAVSATHLFSEEKKNKHVRPEEEPLLESIVSETSKEDRQEPEVSVTSSSSSSNTNFLGWFVFLVEIPLSLPRKLTIPDISTNRWSKPFAVSSAALSPIILSTLLISKSIPIMFSVLVGLILGILALENTESARPPKKFLLPWLVGGFVMSVFWVYITARELVSLLVSLGIIIGISPSILGLTVLAWGNSIGDLIANVAIAVQGGQKGAQIAVSGCYAGPIFNIIIGLGLSFVLSSWAMSPSQFVLPEEDSTLFETLGFLVAALLWALVVLPCRGMKLDRVLGLGLISIYFGFLLLRVSCLLGLLCYWTVE